ncbi:MFS transporter [Desulfosporosinus lacus]|uniref:MFS transporter, putative metabolite:H+ symporter n=1 Tax=Desulfosporosinus lacus DSM 15449 TaxID=1121420 RepID=A0A1M5ZRN2_9FIRM|nr:MFS transporter [Desulfosporosinus lacus]SHI26842.1 MFS transporter, putative metabolite:H+ symporter [Desulfosporosinus lacus DSM 15449]
MNTQLEGKTVSGISQNLKLSNTHYFIIICAALGFFVDSLDLYIVAYAMPFMVTEWKIDAITNGVLASAGIWGALIGSLAWGPISDKIGRKWSLVLTIAGFSVLTGAIYFTTNTTQFMVIRFASGFFLGGAIPIAGVFTSEIAPFAIRGKLTSVLGCFFPAGLLGASLISLFIAPVFGWRAMFIVGAVPIILAFACIKLPESPLWLAAKGRQEEAVAVLRRLGASEEDLNQVIIEKAKDEQEKKTKKVSPAVLFGPKYRKRFAFTTSFYFFTNLAYFGFAMWLPSLLNTVYGIPKTETFKLTLAVACVAILGRAYSAWAIEKFGRKTMAYVGYGVAGAASIAVMFVNNVTLLVAILIIMPFFYEQGAGLTVSWVPELYPPEIRATANAWSNSAGRISSACAPILFGYIISTGAVFGIYLVMAGCFWLLCLLSKTIGIETKGKTLEEIEAA